MFTHGITPYRVSFNNNQQNPIKFGGGMPNAALGTSNKQKKAILVSLLPVFVSVLSSVFPKKSTKDFGRTLADMGGDERRKIIKKIGFVFHLADSVYFENDIDEEKAKKIPAKLFSELKSEGGLYDLEKLEAWQFDRLRQKIKLENAKKTTLLKILQDEK